MPAGVVDDRLHLVELLFPLPDQTLACELLAVRKAHLTATIRCSPVVIAVRSTSYKGYLVVDFYLQSGPQVNLPSERPAD
jgi:hypothetical protein